MAFLPPKHLSALIYCENNLMRFPCLLKDTEEAVFHSNPGLQLVLFAHSNSTIAGRLSYELLLP